MVLHLSLDVVGTGLNGTSSRGHLRGRNALGWQTSVVHGVECPLARSFRSVLSSFIPIGFDHRSNIQVVVFYRIEHFVLV